MWSDTGLFVLILVVRYRIVCINTVVRYRVVFINPEVSYRVVFINPVVRYRVVFINTVVGYRVVFINPAFILLQGCIYKSIHVSIELNMLNHPLHPWGKYFEIICLCRRISY